MCTFRLRRLAVLALPASLLLAPPLQAQGRWSASIHGGLVIPTGDFADDASQEAGLATWGFNLGSDLAMRIGAVPGLEWLSSVQGVSFGVDESFAGDLVAGADVDIGRYWGGLLGSGLRYTLGGTGPRVHLAGQLMVGAMKAPGARVSIMGEAAELVSSWQPAKGYSLGAGASIGERWVVDARYGALINTEIDGEIRYQGSTEAYSGEQAMSWIRLTVGVRVW